MHAAELRARDAAEPLSFRSARPPQGSPRSVFILRCVGIRCFASVLTWLPGSCAYRSRCCSPLRREAWGPRPRSFGRSYQLRRCRLPRPQLDCTPLGRVHHRQPCSDTRPRAQQQEEQQGTRYVRVPSLRGEGLRCRLRGEDRWRAWRKQVEVRDVFMLALTSVGEQYVQDTHRQ